MHYISYCLIRFVGFVIYAMPLSWVHGLGRLLGNLAYYFHTPFRKKAMSNLAIAYGNTLSEKERKTIARKSFQHVMITCLEFFCIKKIPKVVRLENKDEVFELLEKKHGVVFLSGHMANWEVPFVALTQYFHGVAIGRPIKNRWLYEWVIRARETNGGKIIMPKNAIKEGRAALEKGQFLGIVGDQAFPTSSYSYPLFGTRAWTSSTPALLAYRTGSPLVVGKVVRQKAGYVIRGSKTIWPDLTRPSKEEIPHMMDQAMGLLEQNIKENPEQWMWIHDRWKQQTVDHVKRKYRSGFILILLPKDPSKLIPLLPLFRKIYPRSFLTFFAPTGTQISLPDCNVLYYQNEEDLFIRDWKYQLVLDFYDLPKLRRHFLRLGATKVISPAKMKKYAPQDNEISEMIKKTLVKKECLKTVTL